VAYTNPKWMVMHAGAEAGAAAITPKYSTATGYGVERLVDGRKGLLCRFAASQSDHDLEFDFGALITAGLLSADRPITHVYIPEGHNFIGTPANLRLYADATSPAASLVDSYPTPAADMPVDWTLPVGIYSRYIRLLFDGAGQWELPELWLGQQLTTTRGLEQGWENPYRTPVSVVEFPTREVVASLGPARRRWSLTYRDVRESDDDDGVLRTIAQARGAPMVYWPEQNLDPTPTIVRLEDDPTARQDSPRPAYQLGYAWGLRFIEQGT